MQIAILLFDRFTVLDAIGPYQMLPQPPYDAGSLDRAPAEIVRRLRARSRFLLTGHPS